MQYLASNESIMMSHRQKLFPHKSEHLHAEDSEEEQSDKTKKAPLREGPKYFIST